MIDVIAFDADDTLWHNENLYSVAQDRLEALLAHYGCKDGVREALYETEKANMGNYGYGYGLKSFTLSMIETAIRLTGGQVRASDIQALIEVTKEMRRAPIRLLDHVAEVVPALAASYALMVITKGDLYDQEIKLSRSGLAPYFRHVEIVSEKNKVVYRSLLHKHQIAAERFLMVGNSLRSDVLPVAALGGYAVHVPYHITWEHETVGHQRDATQPPYIELEHLGQLPALVERLNRSHDQ